MAEQTGGTCAHSHPNPAFSLAMASAGAERTLGVSSLLLPLLSKYSSNVLLKSPADGSAFALLLQMCERERPQRQPLQTEQYDAQLNIHESACLSIQRSSCLALFGNFACFGSVCDLLSTTESIRRTGIEQDGQNE